MQFAWLFPASAAELGHTQAELSHPLASLGGLEQAGGQYWGCTCGHGLARSLRGDLRCLTQGQSAKLGPLFLERKQVSYLVHIPQELSVPFVFIACVASAVVLQSSFSRLEVKNDCGIKCFGRG